MTNETVFRCRRCGQEKPVSEFAPSVRLRSGHVNRCRECIKRQQQQYDDEIRSRKCSVEGCERRQMARKLCSMHYSRFLKTGDAGDAVPMLYKNPSERPRCIEPNCKEMSYSGRRCKKHYDAFKWATGGKCRIDDCDKVAITKLHQLCRAHDAKRRKWGDPLAVAPTKTGPGITCSINGCGDIVVAKGLCAKHYGRDYVHGDPLREPNIMPEGTRRPYRGGYVMIKATGHPEARMGGRMAVEHRKVMADKLGRRLRPNENVHHINGKRDDNRPENLELWVKSQPSGQRPQDLVAWAREILELYEAEVETQTL